MIPANYWSRNFVAICDKDSDIPYLPIFGVDAKSGFPLISLAALISEIELNGGTVRILGTTFLPSPPPGTIRFDIFCTIRAATAGSAKRFFGVNDDGTTEGREEIRNTDADSNDSDPDISATEKGSTRDSTPA